MKNLGLLIAPPRPSDYILGVNSKIQIDRKINDWSIYLPADESQFSNLADFLICTTMSGPDHSIASQLNYLMATRQLSDEALNFFHNNNYIKDGLFSLSARFNAKLNGTEKTKGQYMNVAADDVRRDGVVSEYDWPTTPDMSWVEFYRDIPIGLFEKGRKSKWFIDIKYQWINKHEIENALATAPTQVGAQVCEGWDSGQVVKKCSGLPLSHATMLYGKDLNQNWLDFDHYPPFKKVLDKDYEFPLNLQYVVTVKPIALRKGMYGCNVLKLQKELNKLGFFLKEDSDFGPKTDMAVKNFQSKHKLDPDGIAGPKTMEKINTLLAPRTLLDAVIQVESDGDDNAIGDKNLPQHAYGALQIRQPVCDDVNRFHGTNYKSHDCLGNRNVSVDIWNKYWQVYPSIMQNEDRARTWNGGPGWKRRYFKENKNEEEKRYCKNLDIYWAKVKSLL